ncbi:putative candidate secreted effector protein [Blumeria hordei DH14]|uniref:Putative candidate secreted effector protein n=1 Tax=Blumeria graminis f. sp. hordei (strain DH14) TaxID=546991 RepID=N1JHN3_BLUG1|nr:putative candidate secreted effector protein [Blumeria hordei DH14]
MKIQSTALGVIISSFFYTIVAKDGPGDYVCDRDYLLSDRISEYVKGSCKSLKYAQISNRHPVTFDGSSHFDILDATLFATLAQIHYMKKFIGGNIGKNRIVIYSMCNLVGLVYVTNRSYKRCVKILDSIDESWSTSLTISNRLPKTYGHDCNSKIFILEETLQYYRNLKLPISTLNKRKMRHYIDTIISTEFVEKQVYLWPIQVNGKFRKYSLDKIKTLHRMAVDKDLIFMGMMYRQGSEWKRCKHIEYVDPEPPRSLDPTKNSIGEYIFENVSAYKCDDVYLSAITINSHMQAACTSLSEDQRNTVGFIAMWPIRREEFSMASITRWNYYVKYDHECNFLGVYLRLNNSYAECEKDESSLHPNKQRPTLTCLNLFPH